MTSFLTENDVFLTNFYKNYYIIGIITFLKSFLGQTNTTKVVPLIILNILKKNFRSCHVSFLTYDVIFCQKWRLFVHFDEISYIIVVIALSKSFLGLTNKRKIVSLIFLNILKKKLGHVMCHF